jgi:hypothetical protein
MANYRLVTAIAEDLAAMREAFEMGLLATKPLSMERLTQLCILGERMRQTALRKSDAERDVLEARLAHGVDVRLPL